ncbi:MAG: tetratricopeptide repeat protein [Bacteroidota bacterium]
MNNSLTRISSLTFVFIFFPFMFLCGQNSPELDSITEVGEDLLSLGEYKEAEKRFDEVLEKDEDFIPAMEGKIKTRIEREKFSRAKRTISDAIENHPEHAYFYLYDGQLKIKRERYDEAIQAFNKALRLVEEGEDKKLRSKIYVYRGAASQHKKDYEKAEADYTKALELNERNPNVLTYRGSLYYNREEFDEALEDFNRVLELDPNNHYAQYNIGMSYFKQNKKHEACDAFHKACELGNRNACKMVVSKCLRERNK